MKMHFIHETKPTRKETCLCKTSTGEYVTAYPAYGMGRDFLYWQRDDEPNDDPIISWVYISELNLE